MAEPETPIYDKEWADALMDPTRVAYRQVDKALEEWDEDARRSRNIGHAAARLISDHKRGMLEPRLTGEIKTAVEVLGAAYPDKESMDYDTSADDTRPVIPHMVAKQVLYAVQQHGFTTVVREDEVGVI